RSRTPPPPPAAPPPGRGEPPKAGEAPKTDTTAQPPAEQPSLPSEQSVAAGGETFAAATGFMMGDQLGIPALAFGSRGRGETAAVIPTARGFKVAENESPRPFDRVYYGFNYFEDPSKAVNTAIGAPIGASRAYR